MKRLDYARFVVRTYTTGAVIALLIQVMVDITFLTTVETLVLVAVVVISVITVWVSVTVERPEMAG